MLEEVNIQAATKPSTSEDFYLSITIDRTARSPCITVSSATSSEPSLRIPFNYANPEFSDNENTAIQNQILSFLGHETKHQEAVGEYIRKLYNIFTTNEAFALETRVSFSRQGEIVAHEANFGFDDAAYRSSGRQERVHKLRDIESEVPEEVKAEESGIVYIK
jgi:succinyl-CoA synthetase alpha subunit